jgi:accessory gene regulator protein AgrB
MALGCGLTSVRGNREENYENEPLVHQKHIKKKKSQGNFLAS